MISLRTGPWKKNDLKKVKKNGLKVFTTFHCGGGSSFGYKLAGFDVIGGVEIDPKMMEVYRANHTPTYDYLEGIGDFNKRKDIPEALRGIDILDGSPPCSSFSMAGSREDKWGKNTKFREGQATQVLDDLFFDFINTADLLRPNIVIAENVKGMLIGNADGYVAEIVEKFNKIGYDVQVFVLNSKKMGIPQRRERVFFLCRRQDLKLPEIKLEFNEPVITLGKALKGRKGDGDLLSEAFRKWWVMTPPGKSFSTAHPKGSFFNSQKLSPEMTCPTVTASGGAVLARWDEPRKLSTEELLVVQSFPDDYDFCGMDPKYIMGMSVPPFMMQRVADQVAKQWFGRN